MKACENSMRGTRLLCKPNAQNLFVDIRKPCMGIRHPTCFGSSAYVHTRLFVWDLWVKPLGFGAFLRPFGHPMTRWGARKKIRVLRLISPYKAPLGC